MKRMILVPEDVYARFEQKQNLETSPIMKNMINTDTDMTDILQRTDVDDTEKQKLYYVTKIDLKTVSKVYGKRLHDELLFSSHHCEK